MKRILHIVGTMDRAGAETMLMNLYRVVDKTKVQFDFLYFTSKKCDFDDEINKLGGEIYRVISGNPVSRMFATIKLLRNNSQWNIVHAHTLFSNAFHVFAAYRAGVIRRISHSHNSGILDNSNVFIKIYHYISRVIQNRYATDFVSCSKDAGNYLFPRQNNVYVFNNSIDSKYFADIGDSNKTFLRKHYNIAEDTLILLQLGRLNNLKNHQFTLQVVKRLKKKNVNFKLIFAGEGILMTKLKEQAKYLELDEEVIFLGLRTDVPYLLAGSDLMILPSLHEGFGLVLVEAQAAGVPSLISDTIPKYSDVCIGLIHVLSLQETADVWSNRIIEICANKVYVEKEKRISAIKKHGFDIYENVHSLYKLYEIEE